MENAKKISREMFEKYKIVLFDWYNRIFQHRSKDLFQINVPRTHSILMIGCTSELLDQVFEALEHFISTKILQTIGAACFMIAIKLFYGYDYVEEGKLLNMMIELSEYSILKNVLLEMEKNIVAHIDWKGCTDLTHYYEE
jgi:hypothetical protein